MADVVRAPAKPVPLLPVGSPAQPMSLTNKPRRCRTMEAAASANSSAVPKHGMGQPLDPESQQTVRTKGGRAMGPELIAFRGLSLYPYGSPPDLVQQTAAAIKPTGLAVTISRRIVLPTLWRSILQASCMSTT